MVCLLVDSDEAGGETEQKKVDPGGEMGGETKTEVSNKKPYSFLVNTVFLLLYVRGDTRVSACVQVSQSHGVRERFINSNTIWTSGWEGVGIILRLGGASNCWQEGGDPEHSTYEKVLSRGNWQGVHNYRRRQKWPAISGARPWCLVPRERCADVRGQFAEQGHRFTETCNSFDDWLDMLLISRERPLMRLQYSLPGELIT